MLNIPKPMPLVNPVASTRGVRIVIYGYFTSTLIFFDLSGKDIRQKGLMVKPAEVMFGYLETTALNSFLFLPRRSLANSSSSNLQTIFETPLSVKFIFLTSAKEILSLLERE